MPQPPGFSPFEIHIFRGSFSRNSQIGNNNYPDIRLESVINGSGPYDLVFMGCAFRGSSDSPKPKYAIEDQSAFPKRCIILGCSIDRNGYVTGFSNKPQAIKDCFDYTTGDLLSEAELHYGWFTENHDLGLGDGFVGDSASGGQRTVTLPSISAMLIGRVFYITKTDDTANNVIIQAQSGQTINGASSVSLSGQRQAYMIIHAGSEWLGIKIA